MAKDAPSVHGRSSKSGVGAAEEAVSACGHRDDADSTNTLNDVDPTTVVKAANTPSLPNSFFRGYIRTSAPPVIPSIPTAIMPKPTSFSSTSTQHCQTRLDDVSCHFHGEGVKSKRKELVRDQTSRNPYIAEHDPVILTTLEAKKDCRSTSTRPRSSSGKSKTSVQGKSISRPTSATASKQRDQHQQQQHMHAADDVIRTEASWEAQRDLKEKMKYDEYILSLIAAYR